MNYIKVGKIHSAQGIRGEIYVYLFAEEAFWIEKWTTLYLSDHSENEPSRNIQIKKVKIHQKQKKVGFVISLENIDNRNLAEELVGLSVFVPEEFLISKEDEGIYLREIIGFKVFDIERGAVGEVIGFSGSDFQDLLVIKNLEEDSFEVPFVKPLLIEIDRKNKIIKMDIPFGLLPNEEL
jgi:16S rRNA processing protein RimM